MTDYILNNLTETISLGNCIGQNASPGDIILLTGGLGAGKTTLTQAIGLGLGIPSTTYITSPTFSIIQEYEGIIPLYHMDLYRLGDEEELTELGIDHYLFGDGLTIIEWPDRLGSYLPPNHTTIDLSIISATRRKISILTHGHHPQNESYYFNKIIDFAPQGMK